MSTGTLRAALVAAALLALGACGSGAPLAGDDGDRPDARTTACREQWRDLGRQVRTAAERTDPSALPERWNSVAATIDYYATSATSKDCGDRLSAQRATDAALTRFEARLRPYDVGYRYRQLRPAAVKYAAGGLRLTKPSGGATKGKPGKPATRLPSPQDVKAAVKVLDAQVATAVAQQRPAWQQAEVVDPADAPAVAKAVKDLAFLSSESPAYRACTTALGTIQRAVSATR